MQASLSSQIPSVAAFSQPASRPQAANTPQLAPSLQFGNDINWQQTWDQAPVLGQPEKGSLESRLASGVAQFQRDFIPNTIVTSLLFAGLVATPAIVFTLPLWATLLTFSYALSFGIGFMKG